MSLLTVRNLRFAYGDRPVLNGIGIELAPGEVIGLLGPNGSGKSTLLRLLLGQLRGSGEIRWEGQEVAVWPRRRLARKVAYLAQSPVVDPEQRVLEVLRTGRAPYWAAFGMESDKDLRIVREVADRLALGELLNRSLAELSGGQRQLVFLARCLVQEPAALLLDEPNTYLDLRHQVELGKLLRQLSREKQIAVLMASHDLNLAGAIADRLILLHDGVIAAAGNPGEVLDPILVGNIYGVPMRRIETGDALHPVLVPDV